MTKEEINTLVSDGIFPDDNGSRELIETHISWVIVCHEFVYKIKKTGSLFVSDFSTLEMRKRFCEREIELNKRLAEGIYLDVQPIYENQGNFVVGGKKGILAGLCRKNEKTGSGKANGSTAYKEEGNEIGYKIAGRENSQFP